MGQISQAEVAQLYAHFCRGLANPNRLLIVCALAEHGMNVGTIATTIGLSQSNTSGSLGISGVAARKIAGSLLNQETSVERDAKY